MAAVDEVTAVWFTEARFLPLLCSNLGTEPPLNISCFRKASTDASVQEVPPLNLAHLACATARVMMVLV